MSRIPKAFHLALAAGCALVFSALTLLPAARHMRDLDIDVLHALAATVFPPPTDASRSSVAVVAIDEATHVAEPFAGLPKVMWTPQLGAVQDAILAGGARVVGWDLILPTSASAYLADRNFDAPLLRSLSRAASEGRVILGTANFGKKPIEPHGLFQWAAGGAANKRSLNVVPDAGGVLRRIPTYLEFEKKDGSRTFTTSMAMEMAARIAGQDVTRSAGGALLGGRLVPAVEADQIVLNFGGASGRIPTYSFADLYACAQQGKTEFFKQHFDGKGVLFGLVLDVEDRKLASNRLYTDGGPLGPVHSCMDTAGRDPQSSRRATVSGVYLQAVAINNILRGDGLMPMARGPRVLVSLLLALLVALATVTQSLQRAVLFSLGLAALWIGVAVLLFTKAQLVPLLAPLFAGLVTFIAVLALRFVVLDRHGRFLKRAFGSYVAPALVEQLVAEPDQLKLGGERRDMSFLFSDLAGFTGLIESRDPEQAVQLLNGYLDRMIEIAKKHGGTIDKVIGDAVVVLFSAPVRQSNHAELAVACALEMDAFASRFAADRIAEGVPFGLTRIGVHSGTAIVGNFGGSGFFDYTALGDAMNTAARLESANKQFGTRVAISGETARRCAAVSGRRIGNVILKGKTEATEVFEPAANDAGSAPSERYRAAYDLMAKQHRGARKAFEVLADEFPGDGLVLFHLKRLKAGQRGDTFELTEK